MFFDNEVDEDTQLAVMAMMNTPFELIMCSGSCDMSTHCVCNDSAQCVCVCVMQ